MKITNHKTTIWTHSNNIWLRMQYGRDRQVLAHVYAVFTTAITAICNMGRQTGIRLSTISLIREWPDVRFLPY